MFSQHFHLQSRQNRFAKKPKAFHENMESWKLAALLSSLMSELLLLLFLCPSSAPFFLTSNSDSSQSFLPLIAHFLFSQDIATLLSAKSVSRKRKRTQSPESESESESEFTDYEPDGDDNGRRPKLGLSRSPDSFRNCFKMTSSTFEWLSGLLEPLLDCRDPVGSPINLSTELRLGIGLFRLATGSDFPKISEQFGVSEPVARFCAKQLCRVLCTNFRFWVEFPRSKELESTSSAFKTLSGFPNCCGVIECTRFKILRNDDFPEESIATQIVVDSSSRILSIIAGNRGDKSNSKVLTSSTLFKDIEGGRLLNSDPIFVNGMSVNQYLIGSGEYPLLPWLMIPFVNTVSGSNEESFNVAHNVMSLPAIRTIVSLRNWGILSRPIRDEFKTAVACIGACSILHNALLMREDFSALSDELESHHFHEQSSSYDEFFAGTNASILRSFLAANAKDFQS